MDSVLNSLYALADEKYRDFNASLVPTVGKSRMIGVRTPALREIAHNMIQNGLDKDFIKNVPHKMFEENQLHAFIISLYRDFDVVISALNDFLPYVDNWATCDQMSPKAFVKNTNKLLPYIKKWMKSKHNYTARFGILTLMRYFMGDNFDTEYIKMVLGIKSKDYYLNMMQAWYFATGAAKHFDEFYPYFENLDIWVRDKAIEKAYDSCRVSQSHKLKLKRLQKRMKKNELCRNDKKPSVGVRVK